MVSTTTSRGNEPGASGLTVSTPTAHVQDRALLLVGLVEVGKEDLTRMGVHVRRRDRRVEANAPAVSRLGRARGGEGVWRGSGRARPRSGGEGGGW